MTGKQPRQQRRKQQGALTRQHRLVHLRASSRCRGRNTSARRSAAVRSPAAIDANDRTDMARQARIAAIGIEIEQRMQRIGAAAFLGEAEEIERQLRHQPPGQFVGPGFAFGPGGQCGGDRRLRRTQRAEQPNDSTGSPASSVKVGLSSRIGRSRLVQSATMSRRFNGRFARTCRAAGRWPGKRRRRCMTCGSGPRGVHPPSARRGRRSVE